jgi:succinate-acetate transporter protein
MCSPRTHRSILLHLLTPLPPLPSIEYSLCLSIAFGEAQLIAAAISVFRNNEWAPAAWQVVLIFWAIMIICAIINAWGVKANLLEPLNTASIYWTTATVLIICITVLVMSDDRRTGK